MAPFAVARRDSGNSSVTGNNHVLGLALPSCIIIAAIAIDTLSAWFIDVIEGPLVAAPGFIMFVATTITMFAASQYLLLGAVRKITRGIRSRVLFLGTIYKVVIAAQPVMAGIIAVIILEMVFLNEYHLVWIVAVNILASGLAAVILGVQAYRFLSWFVGSRDRRKDFVILLYGIAPALSALAIGVNTFTHSSIMLQDKPALIEPTQQIVFHSVNSTTHGLVGVLFIVAYAIPLLASFVALMIGSALHLRYYSKIGKTRYWTIVCLPAVLFFGALVPTLAAYPSGSFNLYAEELVAFRVVVIAGAFASFGVIAYSYITMSRIAQQEVANNPVRDYLLVAAFGIVMLSISDMPPVYHATYPPFGLPAHSLMVITSLISTMSFYSSAISVSEDVRLRRSIRAFARESHLLGKIGTVRIDQELQSRVLAIAKEQSKVVEEVGVSLSMTEEDVKKYLDEVVTELRKNMAGGEDNK